MNLLNNIIYSIKRLIFRKRKYDKVIYTDVHPNSAVPNDALVIVTGGKVPKWLILKCPCGCGAEYQIPLSSTFNPHWKISIEQQAVSVYPSIHVKNQKCGAHFWIKKNLVYWAEPCPSIFSHW